MKDKFFKNIEGKRFLDIGCNAGYFVILAKQLGAKEAIGIDKEPKYLDIAREVAQVVKVKVKFEEEMFSEYLLRLGVFDVINLCSLYHYIFMDIKSHDTIFRILSLMTENLFFENALGLDDPVVSEYANKPGYEFLKTEYTKEKILEAAGKYFSCEYLADHLYPARKVYWLTRKRGNFNINEFVSKIQIHEYREHKYYKVNLPGIKRTLFLKKRVAMDDSPLSEIKDGCDYYFNNLNHIPGLAICYDYLINNDDNSIYILMEYLDKYTNIYSCASNDKQPILKQIIEILGEMIKSGYVNIDMSPLNIFQKAGQVKMIDLDSIKPVKDLSPSKLSYFADRIIDLFKWY
jgi:SAM-dependent methyltransferase